MSDDKDALIYLANVRIDELDAENAKLREELEKWNRLAENIELPEYPVTEFHPKDLERENAKLRELLRDYYVFMFCDCYACRLYDECHGDGCEDRKPFCILPARLGKRTRELGVEVS